MLPDVSTVPVLPTASHAAPAVVARGPLAPSGTLDTPGTGPAAARLRPPTWLSHATAIFVVSRVVTLAAMAVTTTFSHKTLLGEMAQWDGVWFLRAAAHGPLARLPHAHGHVAASTIAFFPLFPLVIRWLSEATGMSPLAAGIVVSTLAGWTATMAVWRLVRRFADDGTADRATLLLLVFPGAFVLSLIYSEGMEITLLALGLAMLLDRRWLAAGLLGLLATATSPVALGFVLPAAWCAWTEIRSRGSWRSVAVPLLTPVGFLAYMGWLWRHTGDLLAWRATEAGGWHSTFSLAFPVHVVVSFVADPVATNKTTDLLFAGIVVTAACAVVAVRSRLPAPLLLYGLAAAAFALCSAPVGLRPRFIFVAFPLVLAVGARLHGRVYVGVVILSAGLLAGIAMFSAATFAIFP